MSLEMIPVVIESGQSLSSAADLGSKTLVAIQMPAAWNISSYGYLSFQVSYDGSTFFNLFDETNAQLSFYADADRVIAFRAFSPSLWAGVRYIKVRSGPSSASPIVQDAERTLQLIVRPLGCSITVEC
jgi:hypothetical protein